MPGRDRSLSFLFLMCVGLGCALGGLVECIAHPFVDAGVAISVAGVVVACVALGAAIARAGEP